MLYRKSENKWYHDAQVSGIAYSYFAVDGIVTPIILSSHYENYFFCKDNFFP